MPTPEHQIERLERRARRERLAREKAEAILEQKSLELWHANRELESRVAARTHELRQAMEAAQAASRAKSMFLASVSHELRTPMNAVIGACSLVLQRGRLGREDRDMLEMVHRSADVLLVVINDILDVSKLASGTVSIRPRPTDVARLVEDCRRFAAAGHGKPHVTSSFEDRRSSPAWLQVDPDRLRQIVLNLGSNAMKFTERGQVRFILADADPGEVMLQVSDTGLGIPATDIDAIFEPFRRVDDSSTRRAGGTGLGLSICRSLAEVMGGTLEVDSEVDRGSTFTLRLPAPTVSPWTIASKVSPEDEVRPGLRILLVEDNLVNVAVIGGMLEFLGCSYEHAVTGRAALEVFEPGEFDLILMDCQMPEMDGLEATRRLRAAHGGGFPIIALTGNAAESDEAESLEAGMDDHASKPISLERLSRVLARWDPRTAATGGASSD